MDPLGDASVRTEFTASIFSFHKPEILIRSVWMKGFSNVTPGYIHSVHKKRQIGFLPWRETSINQTVDGIVLNAV